MRHMARLVTNNPREVLFLVGLLLLALGLHSWSPALSIAVPGAILVAIAVFGVGGGRPGPDDPDAKAPAGVGVAMGLSVAAIVMSTAAVVAWWLRS
ncbi:MAG: hypothetical protein AB7N65_20110 [Vicinamibacterales bacterium]